MCYGYLLIDVKDKASKKYHPIRFYVMNTDVPRILISRAASYWLGLVKVLCDNKVPKIKRQVASVDKKSDFRSKSSPFSKGTPYLGSSSQKKQHSPKTVSSSPSRRMHSFQDAKIQGRKPASKSTSGRDVDTSDKEQHAKQEPSEPSEEELKTPKMGNTTIVKDGPFRKCHRSGSKMKDGHKMKSQGCKEPRRNYYKHSNGIKTFQINKQGHLQCAMFIHTVCMRRIR